MATALHACWLQPAYSESKTGYDSVEQTVHAADNINASLDCTFHLGTTGI